MFARQSAKSFTGRVPERLLKKNRTLYLEYHTRSLHGAPDILPSIVRSMVKTIMDFEGKKFESARSKQVSKVCAAVLDHCRAPITLLTVPTTSHVVLCAKDNKLNIALLTAIVLQHKNLVSHLLEHGASPWNRTYTFETRRPMDLAVRGTSFEILERILQKAVQDHSGHTKKARSNLVVEAIIRALDLGKPIFALHLAQWQVIQLGIPSKSQRDWIFTKAVRTGRISMTGYLLDLGFSGNLKERYLNAIVTAFEANTKAAAILRLCFKKGLVTIETVFRHDSRDKARPLLYWAIKANNSDLVKTILHYDRSKELVFKPSKSLRIAIKENNPSIVQLLLEHGFDPEGGDNPHDKSTIEIARKKSMVYDMVHAAVTAKMTKLSSVYFAPKRYVWSSIKQKDELIAYSFTAPDL
jgi:hypothetical protein